MKWILTQSIFQEHISFYLVYVCVCVFVLPTLSPDCFYFICKFRLISLLRQRGGKEQSHNFLITAPSLTKDTAAARS